MRPTAGVGHGRRGRTAAPCGRVIDSGSREASSDSSQSRAGSCAGRRDEQGFGQSRLPRRGQRRGKFRPRRSVYSSSWSRRNTSSRLRDEQNALVRRLGAAKLVDPAAVDGARGSNERSRSAAGRGGLQARRPRPTDSRVMRTGTCFSSGWPEKRIGDRSGERSADRRWRRKGRSSASAGRPGPGAGASVTRTFARAKP